MNKEQIFSQEWLGRDIIVKTGKLARQATAAATVQYGETVIMATVVESSFEREGVDYFPLMVELDEKLYAAGTIKGSRWIKREGRPTDDAVLSGRMIDRAIRPLFNGGRKDVQVILTVLSVDNENDHDVVALIAASTVLAISGINWSGPISGIRVGRINGEYVFNPKYDEREKSDLDLIVAGTKEKVIMIEAGGNEIKESDMLEAIKQGQAKMQEPIKLINEIKEKIGIKKESAETVKNEPPVSDEENEKKVKFEEVKKNAIEWLSKNINDILFDKTYYTKNERKAAVRAIKEKLSEYLYKKEVSAADTAKVVKELVEVQVEAEVTNGILKNKQRVDSRKITELREITSEVSILPRVHGSGLFSRGETQIMSIITLGSPGMHQLLEGVEGQETKSFMHHYNFPPFSVGEARPIRSAGRREIGHGALAEKALAPVLPTKEEFPYTIRVVSETLGSNGSSSMGATCGSTLALMDAGVPLKKKVAGVAMGLASNADMSEWEVLTDIQDLEDGEGGMDFKIAGTEDGITAIQLDTKTNGIGFEIIEKTLTQGKDARLEILKVMDNAIPNPRKELSEYAPKIIAFKINPEKIGDVIGPGGKKINKLIDEFDVTIDIEDDGTVMVSGANQERSQKAVKQIKEITREFLAGEEFTGKVVRIMDFGIFVELTPGNDGMVHVSKLAPYRINRPSDFIKEGESVRVKIDEIDEKGRINLTMLNLEENKHRWAEGKGKEVPRSNFGQSRGGGFRRR